MNCSTGAHVALNHNQPGISTTSFKPQYFQFITFINPDLPEPSRVWGNFVYPHSSSAAYIAGEVEGSMASGHPHTASSHPPPHPHPHPHPSSHPHHHDTSVPAISTSSSSAASGATVTASIAPPTNPIATTTANHSNHSTPHATIAAAPTNAQIAHVRLMCSYGGRILPRPGDHLLRYVGGETRMVSFPRNASFSTLVSLLSSLSPSQFTPKSPPIIKYQLPHEDLDSLISLCSEEDLINMLDELDRLNPAAKSQIGRAHV